MDQNRNVFVVGFGLFAGLSIPRYASGLEAGALENGLGNVPGLGAVLGIPEVAQTISIILSTQIAVGGIAAFVLDNTIPGTDEERGLTAWEEITEDEDAFTPFHERLLSDEDPNAPKPADD
jgi:hypothetical protein